MDGETLHDLIDEWHIQKQNKSKDDIKQNKFSLWPQNRDYQRRGEQDGLKTVQWTVMRDTEVTLYLN